jgi:hypothetical protein
MQWLVMPDMAPGVSRLTRVKYSATSGGLTAPKGRNSMQNTSRPYTSRPQAVDKGGGHRAADSWG